MRETVRSYAIAILLVVGAVVVRGAAADMLGDAGLFLTLYLATAGAALLGGLGPGLLAASLTAIAAAALLPPEGSLWVERSEHRWLTAGFFAIGVVTSVFAERARQAQARLARSRDAERESAARMQAVRAAAVDAIAIMDDHGHLEFVKPALERCSIKPLRRYSGKT